VRIAISTEGWEVAEPMQAAAAAYNVDPVEWMLTGGEDHALLATFPAGAAMPEGFTVIGEVGGIDEAAGESAGVLVDGLLSEAAGGHHHFG
jgi:thiamine-monophosphate kinase